VTWLSRDVTPESCWRWCHRVNVGHGVMLLLKRLGCGAISLLSHTDDAIGGQATESSKHSA
jgi:hypothetical protein